MTAIYSAPSTPKREEPQKCQALRSPNFISCLRVPDHLQISFFHDQGHWLIQVTAVICLISKESLALLLQLTTAAWCFDIELAVAMLSSLSFRAIAAAP